MYMVSFAAADVASPSGINPEQGRAMPRQAKERDSRAPYLTVKRVRVGMRDTDRECDPLETRLSRV
jgi:hypothetical protein